MGIMLQIRKVSTYHFAKISQSLLCGSVPIAIFDDRIAGQNKMLYNGVERSGRQVASSDRKG